MFFIPAILQDKNCLNPGLKIKIFSKLNFFKNLANLNKSKNFL